MADLEQAYMLDNVLNLFCANSSHKVNTSKTTIFFSKNTEVKLAKLISQILGFKQVRDLGKHLSVPLFHQKVTTNAFKFVTDKVCSKLNGWVTKN